MCRIQKIWLSGLSFLIGGMFFTEAIALQPSGTAERQGWRKYNEFGRLYNSSTSKIVSGNVTRLEKTITADRWSHGVHLLLDTGKEILTVCLGPLQFINSLDMKIAVGDSVEIEGSFVEVDGNPVVIAAKITLGGETVILRDPSGTPVWTGWRRSRADSSERGDHCALWGIVTDSSGATLPHALVLLEPGNESVTTQMDGFFCFRQPDPTTNQMLVIAQGFEEKWTAVRIKAGEPTQLNVVLLPAILNETITVTAGTRTIKKLEEVPVRTEIVLPEIIAMSASRNLADAVEFTPGIRVENNCQNCNFSQIRMLGLDGSYTQILFDGQPTMSSLAQVYGIEHIPARMVERIEVVKGGGSAIYGPGSVGGVINVITRTPSRTGGVVLGRLGWMNGNPNQTFSASADWVSSDNNDALTIFGQSDRISPLDIDGDGFTEVAKREFGALGARYHQNLFGQKAELTVDFNHIRENRRGGDLLHLPPYQANIAEAVNSRRFSGGVGWHHTPNPKFDYRLAVSLADTRRDTYYGAGMDPNAYGKSRNPLSVIDSQFNHFLTSHILSWGGQVTSDGIQDAQPAYEREYNETYRNVGFFVQDDWFLVPTWELVYGVRIDKHSEINHTIVSPRAALMWSVRPTVKVRTSVATGFLPPQVFDEDLHITQVGGEGQVIRNAEDLKEEKSTTCMVGVEWRPRWNGGDGLVEFNLFHTEIKDLFNVVEDDNPETKEVEFTRINMGQAGVYGAEVNFGYALTNELQLEVGWVIQRSRFNEPEPDFGSKDFFRTPDSYGLATFMYRNPRLADLFLGVRFTGRMKVPHYAGYIPEDRLETSPAFWTLDASLSRSFPFGSDSKVTITLGGKNLTNCYQSDLDQGPDRDAGYMWGPRFPRTLYVSTAIEF